MAFGKNSPPLRVSQVMAEDMSGSRIERQQFEAHSLVPMVSGVRAWYHYSSWVGQALAAGAGLMQRRLPGD